MAWSKSNRKSQLSPDWDTAIRPAILRRDRHRCQRVRYDTGRKCGAHANQVDHVDQGAQLGPQSVEPAIALRAPPQGEVLERGRSGRSACRRAPQSCKQAPAPGDHRLTGMLYLVLLMSPTPEPSPTIMVEIVGDPTLTIVGLVISIVSAVVGAVAAVASWRAATAASKATDSGDKAAKHAAEAARAATQSAEYQRASLEAEVEARKSQHAAEVFVLAGLIISSGRPHAQVRVENRGSAPILRARFHATYDGKRVTTIEADAQVAAGGYAARLLRMDIDDPEALDESRLRGYVEFTDPNGVRWQRRTGEVPRSMQ